MRTFMGITTPAEAIEAMIVGLRAHKDLEDFRIDMGTFGLARGDICFGCAATCTLEQLAGKRFTPDTIDFRRAVFLDLDPREVSLFERAINEFRLGSLYALFEFFQVPEYPAIRPVDSWWLGTFTWEAELPKVEAYLEKLKTNTKKKSNDTNT